MMGSTHRALAAVSWLAAAPVLGVHGPLTLAGLAPAVAFSAGVTSPDVDNTRFAKALDGAVPDEALGGCGPLQHRGICHWVGWPVLAGLLLWPMPRGAMWVLLAAAVVGWASHLIPGDLVFGQAGYGTRQGVPLLPWGWHVGLGIKVGGWTEHATALALVGAAVWLAAPSGAHQFVEALIR